MQFVLFFSSSFSSFFFFPFTFCVVSRSFPFTFSFLKCIKFKELYLKERIDKNLLITFTRRKLLYLESLEAKKKIWSYVYYIPKLNLNIIKKKKKIINISKEKTYEYKLINLTNLLIKQNYIARVEKRKREILKIILHTSTK